MALTITSDTVLDEEYRATQTGTADDNDVASSPFISGAVSSLGFTTLSGFAGFPQYAENTSFVTTADPVTDWHLSLPSDGVGSSIYVGGNQVFLYATSDPDIIVGRVGNGTTANASGAVALIVGVDDSNVASPQLWTAQYAPFVETGQNLIDSADQLNLSGLVSLGATCTTSTEVPFENFASVKSGQDAFAPVASTLAGAPDVELLVTGFAGSTAGTVNVSTTGLGTNAQHVDPSESIRIDIVSGLDTSGAMNSTFVHDASNIDYAAHVDVYYGEFSITQLNPTNTPASVSVFAYEDDTAGGTGHDYQGTAFAPNAISDPGTSVQIDAADVIIKNAAGTDITTAFKATAGNSIVSDGNGVKITGLLAGYQVGFTTDNVSFDRFVVTNSFAGKNPSTFDVGAIEVKTLTFGSADESTDLGSHLTFQDDGPKIALSGTSAATITDDDSTLSVNNSASFAALFTAPDYGADGPGSVSYLLGVNSPNVDSGLDDPLTGENVVLSYDSATNTVFGKTQTSGLEVFKITVNASGTITLDQSRAVVQTDTTSSDENSAAMAANLVTLTAKAVDSEAAGHNDSATATANIGASFIFKDDGPALTPQAAGSATPNDLQVTNGGSDSSSYGLLPGADGLKSYTIVGPPDNSGDFQWTYSNTAQTAITGTYQGTSLYTLTLDASTGGYTFTMLHPLPGTTEGLSSTIIHAGGPTDSVDVLAKAPSTDYAHIVADSTVGAGNVNASHGYVGVDNGNLDAGESLTFSLDKSDGTAIDFSQLKIGTKSAGASHYDYYVHMSDGSMVPVGNDVLVPKGGTITVSDPNPNDNVLIDSVEVYKVDGNALKIGLGDIQFVIPPSDVQLGFTVALQDGDNDTTSQSFTVSIDGDGDGVYGATVNSAAVMQSNMVISKTSLSGSHFAGANLAETHAPFDMVHHYHADHMLI